ncbi:UNVERIFIED_CONTAM: hypothetical protein OHV15_10130 [Microbacterium sp. SLM126]
MGPGDLVHDVDENVVVSARVSSQHGIGIDERADTLRIPGVWPLGIVTIPLVVEQSVVMPDGTVQALEPLTRSVTIWALPWPQLLIAAAIALLSIGLFRGRRRRAASVAKLVEEARNEGRRQAERPA